MSSPGLQDSSPIQSDAVPQHHMSSYGENNNDGADGAIVLPSTPPDAPPSHLSSRLKTCTTVLEAKEVIRSSLCNNGTLKLMLKGLKITGAQNAKMSIKLDIIGAKMVQRQLTINDILVVAGNNDIQSHRGNNGDEALAALRRMPTTAVKIVKNSRNEEEVAWLRGDRPIFDGNEVRIGEPPFGGLPGANTTGELMRRPDFEAIEYCRLLHVLADNRMTTARAQLMEPRTRSELDAETIDPWTEHIAPLFNDEEYKPEAVETLSGGVTRSDIACIDPGQRPHERDAGYLKQKFGEFKSFYGTCVTKFEASGQGDPDVFVHFSGAKTYIMYAFCFLKQNPLLQPLATRALQSDAQREEGVGDGVVPDERVTTPASSKKRKRDAQEISILGMDSLSSVLKPVSMDVARATEEAERDKAKFEAAEAKGGPCNPYYLPYVRLKKCLLTQVHRKRGMRFQRQSQS